MGSAEVPNPISTTSPTAASLRQTTLDQVRCAVVKLGSRIIAESPAARPATLADQIA